MGDNTVMNIKITYFLTATGQKTTNMSYNKRQKQQTNKLNN